MTDENGKRDGYFTALSYVPTFNAPAAPVQMATAARAAGYDAPELSQPFRYLDAGCGRGLTLLILAAAYPHATFIGIDFDEAHISDAQARASRCGLTNVEFHCGSFSDLGLREIAQVDFASAYGVYSWVSPDVRRSCFQLFQTLLKPGGLGAVSYNLLSGNAQLLPLRAMAAALLQASGAQTEQALAGVLDALQALAEADSGFFAANPVASRALAEWRNVDIGYLAHELLNDHWTLANFSEVKKELEGDGLTWVGDRRATLWDTPLSDVHAPDLLEDMLMLTTGAPFRTDVFTKTPQPPHTQPRFADDDCFALVWPAQTAAMQELAAREDKLGSLVRLCAAGPRKWSNLRTIEPEPAKSAARIRDAMQRQVLTLLGPKSAAGQAEPSVAAFRLTEEILTDPALSRMSPALPSARLGGAAPLPLIIAHLARAKALNVPARDRPGFTAEAMSSLTGGTEREKAEIAAMTARADETYDEIWGCYIADARLFPG